MYNHEFSVELRPLVQENVGGYYSRGHQSMVPKIRPLKMYKICQDPSLGLPAIDMGLES
jgi:hypothetical protein